jgi:hypothetical protein
MRITAILLALSCLASCAEKPASTPQPASVAGKPYALGNPFDWEVQQQVGALDFVLLSPAEDQNDTFRENVNVVIEHINEGVSHQAYLEASIANNKRVLGPEADVEYEPTAINGVEAFRAHLAYQMGAFDLAVDSYVVISGRTSYIITCTATRDSHDAFKPKFDAIVATFVLK